MLLTLTCFVDVYAVYMLPLCRNTYGDAEPVRVRRPRSPVMKQFLIELSLSHQMLFTSCSNGAIRQQKHYTATAALAVAVSP